MHEQKGHRPCAHRCEPGIEALAVEVKAQPSVLAAARPHLTCVVHANAAVPRNMRADADTADRPVVRARPSDGLDIVADVLGLEDAAVEPIDGGVLEAEYVGDNVKTIRRTSAYYRTVSGIGVGAHVPRDRCVRMNDTGEVGPRGCKNTWLSFDFDGECLDAWLTSMGARTMTLLFMHRGRRIEAVRIGDPDVILPCF